MPVSRSTRQKPSKNVGEGAILARLLDVPPSGVDTATIMGSIKTHKYQSQTTEQRKRDHNLPKSRTNLATVSRNSGVEPSSAKPFAML